MTKISFFWNFTRLPSVGQGFLYPPERTCRPPVPVRTGAGWNLLVIWILLFGAYLLKCLENLYKFFHKCLL